MGPERSGKDLARGVDPRIQFRAAIVLLMLQSNRVDRVVGEVCFTDNRGGMTTSSDTAARSGVGGSVPARHARIGVRDREGT
jgi:hypothetical protein